MKTTCWVEFGVAVVSWCLCLVTVKAAVRKTIYTSAELLCGDSYAEARFDSLYKTAPTSSKIECAHMCFMDDRCASFNVDESRRRCELNEESFVCGDLDAPAAAYAAFQQGPAYAIAPANVVATQETGVAFTYTILPSNPYATVRDNCIAEGGELANLADQAVYGHAIAFLEVMPVAAYGDRLWIGAEDMDQDGTWLWNDGTELTSVYPNFTPFVSWPPQFEHCAMLWSQRDNYFGLVTVQQCGNLKQGLCKKPAP